MQLIASAKCDSYCARDDEQSRGILADGLALASYKLRVLDSLNSILFGHLSPKMRNRQLHKSFVRDDKAHSQSTHQSLITSMPFSNHADLLSQWHNPFHSLCRL